MCGIVGTLDWSGRYPPDEAQLRQMLSLIRHRGPDEAGIYIDGKAGLGNVRLSILDLNTGQQPISNEDGTLWIVYNGEVYNYVELRRDLERAGHRFTTHTDTEVILHLFEDQGPTCLNLLNGQFAIAIWDAVRERLFLARDRVGVRPLFYAECPHGLVFGSEIKALFVDPRIRASLDPYALAQTFTFWAPIAPRTAFEGVRELPPGHFVWVAANELRVERYWQLTFPPAGEELSLSEAEAAEQLRSLLSDATRLRLRADVPVGAYVSGGIDSTYIAALIRQHTPDALSTFSIAFEDPVFDERVYQERATAFLGTTHYRTECKTADVGQVFPSVIWHTEAPILRTSPAPMFLLSKLVHEHGIKVVLTGEGSDEFLGGYNIFKEDKVRRFWARAPESRLRPMLLRRLYPYVGDLSREGDAFLAAFFGQELTPAERPGYSHAIRWRNTARLQPMFFSPELRATLAGYHAADEFLAKVDGLLAGRSHLAQAQALEITSFMSPYLLSSQGDRVMSAHAVEGRFPFLDHRVIEFCNALPPHHKLHNLEEKHVLKVSAAGLIPAEIAQRRKQPYRAPIHRAFLADPPAYVDELLSADAIRAVGVCDPQAIERLRLKAASGRKMSEPEDMALAGILSTQLLHRLFVADFPHSVPEVGPVRICRGKDDCS